jgi:hypothetical protein
MSSEFEKFVRYMRRDFDDKMSSENVWKKIEKSLPAGKEVKRFTIRDIYKWSAAAAAFFIVLTSAWFLFNKKYSHENSTVKSETTENSYGPENFNGISPEYAIEFKQASLAVENRQRELRSAIANNPELYKKFQMDLNILDSSYRMLQQQAVQSVNRDVILKAMIQNLQLQSELLSRQLMIIHEFKTTKTNKNEKDL